jgi:hypothetical protein
VEEPRPAERPDDWRDDPPKGDPHRSGHEEPQRGTTGNDDEPDPDVEGPTPDSERERHES